MCWNTRVPSGGWIICLQTLEYLFSLEFIHGSVRELPDCHPVRFRWYSTISPAGFLSFTSMKFTAMKHSTLFYRTFSYPILAGLGLLSTPVMAASYGIYEARGLAMGAVVASSNLAEAHYYNPALLAYHEGDEDEGQDNHFNFDLVVQSSGPIDSLKEFYDEEYDVVVTDAVDAFNTAPSPASADAVLSAIEDLDASADELGKAPVDFDSTIGFSFNLPGDHEGELSL